MKALIACFLLILPCAVRGQYLHSINLLNRTANAGTITVATEFNFGSAGNCPEVEFVSESLHGDTLKLNVFYDIDGAWPQFYCNRVDTIATPSLSSQVHFIKVITNTVTLFDTTYHLDDSTINLSSTDVGSRVSSSLTVAPNPATHELVIAGAHKGATATIYSLLGQPLLHVKMLGKADVVSIANLPSGAYLLVLKGDGDETQYVRVTKH